MCRKMRQAYGRPATRAATARSRSTAAHGIFPSRASAPGAPCGATLPFCAASYHKVARKWASLAQESGNGAFWVSAGSNLGSTWCCSAIAGERRHRRSFPSPRRLRAINTDYAFHKYPEGYGRGWGEGQPGAPNPSARGLGSGFRRDVRPLARAFPLGLPLTLTLSPQAGRGDPGAVATPLAAPGLWERGRLGLSVAQGCYSAGRCPRLAMHRQLW
jgi:hypothetical protein